MNQKTPDSHRNAYGAWNKTRIKEEEKEEEQEGRGGGGEQDQIGSPCQQAIFKARCLSDTRFN